MSDLPSTSANALPADAESTIPEFSSAGAGCPPPLRCREVAACFDHEASAWELEDSPLGTHGWCWGSGPPLYLLPPVGGPSRLFVLLAYLLRDQYRCVLVDWRGPVGKTVPTLDLFAADLERVLTTADETDVVMHGSSFGAAVAIRTAVRTPQRIGALILHDVARVRRLSLGESLLTRVFRRSARTLQQVPGRVRVAEVNHRRWFPPLDPDRWDWFLEVTGTTPLRLLAAQARSIHGVDQTADFQRLSSPVLVFDVEGLGPMACEEQQRVRELLPHGKSASLHSTGSYPGLTHPHRLKKLIEQFLAAPHKFAAEAAAPEFFPLNSRSSGTPTSD